MMRTVLFCCNGDNVIHRWCGLRDDCCERFAEGQLMRLRRDDEGFSVDASLLGELLDVPASRIQSLMRRNEITCLCERGDGEARRPIQADLLLQGPGVSLQTVRLVDPFYCRSMVRQNELVRQ